MTELAPSRNGNGLQGRAAGRRVAQHHLHAADGNAETGDGRGASERSLRSSAIHENRHVHAFFLIGHQPHSADHPHIIAEVVLPRGELHVLSNAVRERKPADAGIVHIAFLTFLGPPYCRSAGFGMPNRQSVELGTLSFLRGPAQWTKILLDDTS